MKDRWPAPGRRDFLRTLGGGALGLALAGSGLPAEPKPLRGVFPIGQTPVTESDKLDLECLQNEVKFCNRFKVHGFAWPQIASGWASLSEKERLDGAEAILAAGKGGHTALVIGVQNKEGDIDRSIAYAKHAAANGADAIISLPPEKADDQATMAYYKTLGQATQLPLIVQSRGDMSVDLIVAMARQIPTMKCIKDEAGNPLARVGEIRERTGDNLAVFSGNGVRTMIDEMRLGFSGHCPFTVLADFYAATFDLWHAGKRREAFDMFGRIQAFSSITGANSYLMVVRGVFRENTKTRAMSTAGGGRSGQDAARPLDEATKQAVRDSWDQFMKPYLRG
ncbi:MAG: dihydrodipicolinate synthase family protein [Bryobacteraceae bacterium]|jgi:4-hydroxy-tetrahydrodipicolinate synthase